MRWTSGCLAFLIGLRCLQPADAAQQQPAFASRTDLVRLDVSVLGRDRAPVLDLTAADFTIRENGREAGVELVTLVRLAAGGAPTAANAVSAAPYDVATNRIGLRERLTVIVLDDAMTPAMPAFVEAAKLAARSVLEQLGPDDAASVVFTEDSRQAVGLTTDFARLRAAIDTFRGGGLDVALLLSPATGVRLAQEQRAVGSMATLRNVAEVLGKVPDRRKTIIHISPGMPIELGGTPTDRSSPGFIVNLAYQAMLRAARDSNVNVFTIESTGLDGLRQLMERASADLLRFPDVYEEQRRRIDALSSMFSRSLRTLTAQTGGRAFTGTNAFVTQAPEIFREAAAYYLVGYRPPDPKADGRLRRIDVRVNRPGVTVRARAGYYAAPPSPTAGGSGADAAARALADIVPASGVPLTIAAAAVPTSAGDADRRPQALVTLRLPLRSASSTPPWRVTLRAFTMDGAALSAQQFAVSTVPATSDIEVVVPVRLPPGRHELRAGVVRDDGAEAGVHVPIEVPAFDREPVALSGVVVSVESGAPSTLVGDAATKPPFLPTTQRAFRTEDRVRTWTVVTQEGAAQAVEFTAQIVDSMGTTRFDRPLTLGSDEFGPELRVTQTLDIPVRALPPGEYLLTLTATRGSRRAVQRVRFEMLPPTNPRPSTVN